MSITVKGVRNEPDLAHLYSNFGPVDPILAPRFEWDGEGGFYTAPWSALLTRSGDWKSGLSGSQALLDHARSLVGVDLSWRPLDDEDAVVPQWFVDAYAKHGKQLRPYQVESAVAGVTGWPFNADPTGLGKSICTLASQAIAGSQRLVVVCPPTLISNWVREITQTGVASLDGTWRDLDPGDGSPYVVAPFHSGRKEPSLPERGVVVVPDSLITARCDFEKTEDISLLVSSEWLDRLALWRPDGLIVDESHRTKDWWSQRSQATRAMADRVTGLRMPATATPMAKHPGDLAAQLYICGKLDLLGGREGLEKTYCVKRERVMSNRRTVEVVKPRMRSLPKLRQILREEVWIRHNKLEVLPDLPSKSAELLVADVDLASYHKTHKEIIADLKQWATNWAKKHHELPTEEAINAYCSDHAKEYISRLRRAAGEAKAAFVAEWVAEWVAGQGDSLSDDSVSDDPLLMWVHHKNVMEACVEALSKHGITPAIIDGSTPTAKRGDIVDDFQEGRTRVLICSITAANTGITLTRGNEALFVETDWDPNIVVQAQDRQWRIGQERPIIARTVVAPGTLDPHIQRVQERKSQAINMVMGDDLASVSVGEWEANVPSQILADMIYEVLDQVEVPGTRRTKKIGDEVVYFMRLVAGGRDLVKIGYTNDLARRHAEVKAGEVTMPEGIEFADYAHAEIIGTILCPEGTGQRIESKMHNRYAHFRVEGEWFETDETILSAAKAA